MSGHMSEVIGIMITNSSQSEGSEVRHPPIRATQETDGCKPLWRPPASDQTGSLLVSFRGAGAVKG